ncbi:MAG TPA: HD domain-containing phosphohydrolase [Actinomycetota bacterium]|nr:HD domain-containing phosphohydrolase [Actinomycetota bacterium]
MTPRSVNRTFLSTGLLIGILTAILFSMGIFEPLESKLYDQHIRRLPQQEDLAMTVLLASGSGPFSPTEAAELVRLVEGRGAPVIALNEPVSGAGDELNALVQTAVNHGGVIFSYEYADPQVLAAISAGRLPRSLQADAYAGSVGADRRIQEASVAVGFNHRVADADGTLRRFTPTLAEQPEIALAVASVQSRGVVELPRTTPTLGKKTWVGPGPRLLIPYSRSVAPLVPEALGEMDLSETAVIIGRAEGTMWKTPIGPMSDAEVTQQIAFALAHRRGITRAPFWMVVIALIAVSTALTSGGMRPKAWLDIALPLAVAIMVYVVAVIAFKTGTWMDTVPLLFAMAAQMTVLSVISRSIRIKIGQMRQIGRQERMFFAGFLETMTRAAMADSGRAWLKIQEHCVDRASTSDVPDHVLPFTPTNGVIETNRDEGQLVLIGFDDGTVAGGLALQRPRSLALSPERLELIQRCAAPFVARIQEVRSGNPRAAALNALREVAMILDEEDHFPTDHPDRIARLAGAIAKRLQLSQGELAAIETASYLHDLGKIGVPDALIDTNERLTDEEYEKVKSHALVTQNILLAFGLEEELVSICGAHHERWDGRGYPKKLSGEEIPMGARILAVADTITSMTSDRPYRKGMSLDVALEEVTGQRSRMFDPKVVKVVTELVAEQPELVDRDRLRPSA